MDLPSTASLFKALANERRLLIMQLLLSTPDPIPVGLVAAHLGVVDGIASQQLSILAKVGLVTRIPHENYVFYEPNQVAISELKKFWDVAIERNPR